MSGNVQRMNLTSGASNNLGDNGQIYYIKNKDRVIGTFKWDKFGAAIMQNNLGLPRFVADDLDGWLESRTPPKHREHMKSLFDSCGLSDTRSVIDFSKALSLTDTFWVTPDKEVCWDSVSLFQNEFDEIISRIAFEGGLYGIQFSTTSPEFGTGGMLAKCWKRDKLGKICLIKTGTEGFSNTGNEPLSEVLASQVLDCLAYPHVKYFLGRYHGKRVSTCYLMISEKEMLLPICRYYNFSSMLRLFKDCREDGIASGLAQMLIYDYLSWNTDRHAGNLGVILDADTYELKRFAPLWDHGCSMLCYWNGTDDLDEYVSRSGPALYNSFEWGAAYGKEFLGNQHNVERLLNFKFDLSQIGDYPVDRVLVIQEWLHERAQKFLEM